MSAASVEAASYAHFAERVRGEGLLSDPWLGGQPRFSTEALALPERDWQAIGQAAEAMAAVHDEMVRLLMRDSGLLESYFKLGPAARALWECAAPRWHGIARADMFLTESGPMLCELNSDTPSGQAEAATLSRLFAGEPGRDPNAGLEARFCAWVAHAARGSLSWKPSKGFQTSAPARRPPPRSLRSASLDGRARSARGAGAGRVGPSPRRGRSGSDGRSPSTPTRLSLDGLRVGLLYPTEFTEDLGLVLLYERWLGARGAAVVLGSPFNLQPWPDGRVALLGQPCDVFLRHYKTDWWTEREPVWLSEAPFPDREPLASALALLLGAELDGRIAVLNPFGALVTQNKRGLALLWEERRRFSAESQAAIARYLPPTFRLETLSRERLRDEREAWVLKSDYGCEGEETIVGRATSQPDWEATLAEAKPGRFIAQRCFAPLRDRAGYECNLGVYLVAGSACGLYARRSKGPTDAGALSTAVRIVEGPP